MQNSSSLRRSLLFIFNKVIAIFSPKRYNVVSYQHVSYSFGKFITKILYLVFPIYKLIINPAFPNQFIVIINLHVQFLINIFFRYVTKTR